MTTIVERMEKCGIVPVVAIDAPDQAVPLARALVAGGIDVIEITLRTPAALDALERVAHDCPDMVCLAGTVIEPGQVAQVHARGAQGVISPGFTEAVSTAMREAGLPWFPGVATASDVMRAVGEGWRDLKFFPAEQAGGIAAIKALAGPFPQVRFCPTGGIGPSNLDAYLAVPAVIAVGGSWIVPASALRAGDFDAVTALAREARSGVDRLRGR